MSHHPGYHIVNPDPLRRVDKKFEIKELSAA
jgi:hypothetical protein